MVFNRPTSTSDTLTSAERMSKTEEFSALCVMDAIRQAVGDMHPGAPHRPVNLDSSLERDLGFDSLGRVELMHRIQRACELSLPEEVWSTAETPADLIRAALFSNPTAQPPPLQPVCGPLGATDVPESAATLLEVLEWYASAMPERVHIRLLDPEGAETPVTYHDLRRHAARIAAGLLENGFQPGGTVALMLPTGSDYFFSFFGILLAGGVPVPIYPPFRPAQLEEHLTRHAGILDNAQAAVLITTPAAVTIARLLGARAPSLRMIETSQNLGAYSPLSQPYRAKPGDTALLQYTSGSTGNPKGVVLTHQNLLANIRAMGKAAGVNGQDVFVSWLPLYHDMGLIGAWLGSLYFGCPLIAMTPLSFLARPERWLWAIHRFGGTLSAAPNFAYELCVSKIADQALTGLDLSSWRMAFNGAEPVSPGTIGRFQERFEPKGFRPEAMSPVYGLAECSVGLAFPPRGRGPRIDRIRRDDLTRHGRAVPAVAGAAGTMSVVACGLPLPGHEIRVVDGTGQEVPERMEGRIEFRGPSATAGYFRNPSQTRQLFHGDWLDSGDYGYMAEGEIYLTGRVKDIIIRGGRNIYPYELEEAVGSVSGVRKGCVAAFGVTDQVSGTERLIVAAETRETQEGRREALQSRIGEAVISLLGMPPDEVVLVPPHTILKTSSGKIRRSACRESYLAGFGNQRRPVWRQLLRFALSSGRPSLRRWRRTLTELAYATYAWSAFWTLAPLVWAAAALLPRPAWAWKLSHGGARLMMRLSGIPWEIRGMEQYPRGTPVVVTANHMSYLDGILLVASLPGTLSPTGYFAFIAKRELADRFVSRIFLRRLGTLFVDRDDPRRGVSDVKEFGQTLQGGQPLIFFPEGTFDRMPGLLPFRTGAFSIAAEAGVAVVPIVITGTRSILRGDSRFPRMGHAAVTVTVAKPILPRGAAWEDALRLRDETRAAILLHCGEPDRMAIVSSTISSVTTKETP